MARGRGRGKVTKRKYAEDDISNASTLKKRKVNDAVQTRHRFTSKVNTDEKATTGEEGHNQHKPKYKATKRKYAEDNIIDGLSFMKDLSRSVSHGANERNSPGYSDSPPSSFDRTAEPLQ
eukprot:Seg14059.1 transcript_id=Seg14059.1/GoldUCD/mRNA.D3Y31 product="hypothetical protein" protein_id=Seg14059.1/GoldUCD/D3Y31